MEYVETLKSGLTGFLDSRSRKSHFKGWRHCTQQCGQADLHSDLNKLDTHCQRMLGKVLYRKATLEDWGDIERVSQVLFSGELQFRCCLMT